MDFDFEKLGLKNNNKTTENEDLGKFLTVKELGFILIKDETQQNPRYRWHNSGISESILG